MFKSPVLRSEGPPMEYPKTIWSTSGGWYAENAMWKRNTAIVGVGLLVGAFMVFKTSANWERRMRPGPVPVPSQRWSAHTLIDDPDYPEKLAKYQQTKKPLWERIFQTKEDFIEE